MGKKTFTLIRGFLKKKKRFSKQIFRDSVPDLIELRSANRNLDFIKKTKNDFNFVKSSPLHNKVNSKILERGNLELSSLLNLKTPLPKSKTSSFFNPKTFMERRRKSIVTEKAEGLVDEANRLRKRNRGLSQSDFIMKTRENSKFDAFKQFLFRKDQRQVLGGKFKLIFGKDIFKSATVDAKKIRKQASRNIQSQVDLLESRQNSKTRTIHRDINRRSKGKVRFIRKNGRIIPIRSKK